MMHQDGEPVDPKRVVAEGYDRLGPAFSGWVAENPKEVRSWFLGEVLTCLGEGADVLELGCGPGTAAKDLSADDGTSASTCRGCSSRSPNDVSPT